MPTLCRFCNKADIKEGQICPNCGYDPKTNTISPSFKPKAKNQDLQITKSLISPAVKIFALLGIAVVIFSVLFKYDFKPAKIIARTEELVKQTVVYSEYVNMESEGKEFVTNRTQLISDEAMKKAAERKDLVLAGVFFVPNKKSYIIINQEVVEEGQTFNGILVEKVYRDKVELVIKGKRLTLKVNESIPFMK